SPADAREPWSHARRRMNTGSGASDIPAVPRARAYLLAVAATALAAIGTLPLQRTFERFPYLPLLVGAVIVSAWVGGFGPGVVAAGGGAVAAEYLVVGGLDAVGIHPELLAHLATVVALAAVLTSIRRYSKRASSAASTRWLCEFQEPV